MRYERTRIPIQIDKISTPLFVSAVRVRMQQGTYIVQEELGAVEVCALLDGQIARNVPVSFTTFEGTAEGISIIATTFVFCYTSIVTTSFYSSSS